MDPSLLVLTTIFSKSSGLERSLSVIIGYSNTVEDSCGRAPTLPPGIRVFCSAIAAETSAGVMLRLANLLASNHTRMEKG
ncbi:hypothetical protein D3C81_1056380 [compost metagenome]